MIKIIVRSVSGNRNDSFLVFLMFKLSLFSTIFIQNEIFDPDTIRLAY